MGDTVSASCTVPTRVELMTEKQLVFIAGLHRSGTSLLHQILRSHPTISGFANTGVPQDEGQLLQSVYLPARAFGGPGRFGFDPEAYMDENHPLATEASAKGLLQDWSAYWDISKPCMIEKSPPNLIRTRFLQRLFPDSCFIIVIRHPIAVAYATQKWSKTSIASLVEHSLVCHERFFGDRPYLRRVFVLSYEEFVVQPRQCVQRLCEWLGVENFDFTAEVRSNMNDAYFARWRNDCENQSSPAYWEIQPILSALDAYEARFNRLGYTLKDLSMAPSVRNISAIV